MKYWAYVNNEILGPFEKEKLLELPSFAPSLLICPQTPVGEKTEDWKEASSYPEISAVMSAGTMHAAPAIDPQSAQESHAAHTTDRKPLTAAAIDPIPPKENSNLAGIDLPVGHLERSGRISAVSAAAEHSPAQASASFDPLTLSGINKKAAAPEGIMGEPRPALGASAAPITIPGLEQSPVPFTVQTPAAAPGFGSIEPGFNSALAPAAATPAPAPAAAQPFAAPAQQQAFTASAPAAQADTAAMAEMTSKLDTVLRSSASKQDVAMALDPLKMKMEQMGEVLANMKNSQFQREIIDKLAYLENAVADLKTMVNAAPAAAPAAARPAAELKVERPSETYFGAQSAARTERKKTPAPEAAGKKTEVIVDEGSSKFGIGAVFRKIGALIKKLLMFVFTLVLLAAVAMVAAVLLKNAGVFDASRFIPFPVPFLSSPAQAPQAAEAVPAEQAAAQPQAAPAEAQPAEKKPVDISPEVIYFARYYKTSETGAKLEDTITGLSLRSGGKYDPSAWQARNTAPDMYEVSIAVPGKAGSVSYTYNVDYAKKTLEPVDAGGKAAFDALTPKAKKGKRGRKGAAAAAPAVPEAEALPPGTPPGTPPGVKVPAKPAAGKPAAAKPAAAKAGKTSVKAAESPDEYEYVYEEE